MSVTKTRIGQGVDIHAFDASYSGPATTITLGGVQIPFVKPLLAHSDGDVVLHALCDAILGALALGDIGQLFPDSDPAFHNVDSRELLREVMRRAAEAGYALGNADITVVAEYPKIAMHSLPMREHIAADCTVALDAISVKATTSERLGFTGRAEGIACFAQVLMVTCAPRGEAG